MAGKASSDVVAMSSPSHYGSPGCCYYDAASKEALARIIMAASLFGVFRSVSVALPLDALASCELRGAGSLLLLLAYLRRLDCSLHFVSQTGAAGDSGFAGDLNLERKICCWIRHKHASELLCSLPTKVHVNTKNWLLSAQLRHTASSSQTEEEGRGGREPVGEM